MSDPINNTIDAAGIITLNYVLTILKSVPLEMAIKEFEARLKELETR